MPNRLRALGLFIVLAAAALPARADPVLMFLLGLARNLIESSLVASRAAAPPQLGLAEVPKTYPGTLVQPEHLRRLIDDCFTHLSEKQRGEVFETLHTELLKPKNAAVRGEMIRYFAHTALQVRALQFRLAQLSAPEKLLLAQEFGRTIGDLPSEERAQLKEVLERRLLPVPPDLGELLAEQAAKEPIPVAESAYERAAPTVPMR